MNDEDQSKPLSRRRVLIAGGFGGMALVAFGFGRLGLRALDGQNTNAAVAPDGILTVVAFTGALFGRDLSDQDVAELSDRLNFRLSSDATFSQECAVLAQYLDGLARERGEMGFRSCSDLRKELIVRRIMNIDYTSVLAKVLRRLSAREGNYYRMRWSTVWQLSWLYSQSGVAWRARGYARSPGVPGDWREIVAPGAPYP